MWYAIGKNKPRTKPQKIIISIDKFGLSGSKGPSIILKLFPKAKKKLNIIKKGDHSLSSKKWLKIILKELKLFI